MNGGYVMFDLSSLDWSDGDEQELSGAYERAKEAYNSGSLVLVGVDIGGVVPGYISKNGNNYSINGYLTSPYTIVINPQDKVSIAVQ